MDHEIEAQQTEAASGSLHWVKPNLWSQKRKQWEKEMSLGKCETLEVLSSHAREGNKHPPSKDAEDSEQVLRVQRTRTRLTRLWSSKKWLLPRGQYKDEKSLLSVDSGLVLVMRKSLWMPPWQSGLETVVFMCKTTTSLTTLVSLTNSTIQQRSV